MGDIVSLRNRKDLLELNKINMMSVCKEVSIISNNQSFATPPLTLYMEKYTLPWFESNFNSIHGKLRET